MPWPMLALYMPKAGTFARRASCPENCTGVAIVPATSRLTLPTTSKVPAGKCDTLARICARVRLSRYRIATLPCQASAACCILRFKAWSASLAPTAMAMVLVSGNSAMACASVPGKSTFAFCCQMTPVLPGGKGLPDVLIASTGTPRASGASSVSR
ncbi:hypothetical protein JaAD80_11290 [Janthinobacterium sp. AD80]|nr:hypothetical protein JaAD80_11290 [Janthinobacterium sp. AD80]